MWFNWSIAIINAMLQLLDGCGLCLVEVSTRHVGLWTHVHSWTHVRIQTCPIETSTKHKPFPF